MIFNNPKQETVYKILLSGNKGDNTIGTVFQSLTKSDANNVVKDWIEAHEQQGYICVGVIEEIKLNSL